MEHNFTKSKDIERCVNIKKKIKLKVYNKFNLCNIKKVKILIFWFFRILKCVTKRDFVMSKVRKDPRGNFILKLIFHFTYFYFNSRKRKT